MKPLKWAGGLAILAIAIVILIVRGQRHEQRCAEAAELLKQFQVISDPFTRPKLYRHKDTKNLNPGAKLPDDEVLFLVTSEGNVVIVNTFPDGVIPTDDKGMPAKRFTTPSGVTLSFGMSANRIKLLAMDLVFEARLDPCFSKAGTADRYRWVPGWVHQDKEVVELLGKAVVGDNDNRPYLYRLNIGNIEGSIAGAQLTALKQTFRLAELIRETGK